MNTTDNYNKIDWSGRLQKLKTRRNPEIPPMQPIEKAAVIQQAGKNFNLYTKDGKRPLGVHKTYEGALAQERAIQASKHMKEACDVCGCGEPHAYHEHEEYVKNKKLRKEAYDRGFFKAALANNIDPLTAVELLKLASSSGIGRYFAEKGVLGDAMIDHPYRMTAGTIPGQVLGHAAFAAGGPLAATLASPLTEMGAVATFGGKQNRKEKYQEASDAVKERGTLENMHHSGKKLTPLMAALGALAGGGIGAMQGHDSQYGHGPLTHGNLLEPYSTSHTIGSGLLGAGIGAGVGALSGYAGGALGGAINSAETKGPSEESRQRALKMKTNHPYLTSLPFGDVIGAAVS